MPHPGVFMGTSAGLRKRTALIKECRPRGQERGMPDRDLFFGLRRSMIDSTCEDE
jgi:hypothetical protein